jgi:hypothetical protein
MREWVWREWGHRGGSYRSVPFDESRSNGQGQIRVRGWSFAVLCAVPKSQVVIVMHESALTMMLCDIRAIILDNSRLPSCRLSMAMRGYGTRWCLTIDGTDVAICTERGSVIAFLSMKLRYRTPLAWTGNFHGRQVPSSSSTTRFYVTMTTSRTLVYRRMKGQGEAVFCNILLCISSIRVDQEGRRCGEGEE